MPYDRDIDDSEREDIRRRFSLLVEIGQLLDEPAAPAHAPREAPEASVPPVVAAPTEEVQARLRRLERILDELRTEVTAQRTAPSSASAERDAVMPNLLAAIEALDRRQDTALATLRAELAEIEARLEARLEANTEAQMEARIAAPRRRARPVPAALIGAALLLVGLVIGGLAVAGAPTGALRRLAHDTLPRIAVQHLPPPAVSFLRGHGLLPKVFIEPAAMPALAPPPPSPAISSPTLSSPTSPSPAATPLAPALSGPPAPPLENAAPDVRQLRPDPAPAAAPSSSPPAPAGDVTGSAEPTAVPDFAPVPAPVPVVATLPAPIPDPAASSTPPPAAASDAPQRLVLRARSDAWVQVRDRQGHVMLNRLMRGGEAWTVPEAGMLLSTGNAAATELVVDGAEPRVLGTVGTVRRDIPLDADLVRSGKLGVPAPARPKPAPPR